MESLEEFLERMKLGLFEEYELVMIIMEHLIDPEQTLWLKEQGLEISDLLNGRFTVDQWYTVTAIFMDWNLKLRKKVFTLGGSNG